MSVSQVISLCICVGFCIHAFSASEPPNIIGNAKQCARRFSLEGSPSRYVVDVTDDLPGHMQFIRKHFPWDLIQIREEQVREMARNLLDDPIAQALRPNSRGYILSWNELFDYQALLPLAEAVSSVHRDQMFNADQISIWEEVRDRMLIIISELKKDSLPWPKDQLWPTFFKELRARTLPHVILQSRMTGKWNISDCVYRGFRDMFHDPALLNQHEYDWLLALTERTKGDYNQLTPLIPKYDR